MVNRICFIFLVLLFCRLVYLYPQEAAKASNNDSKIQKSYFIEEGKEGSSLYQHLSWEAIDDILGYEFLLEKKDQSGNWI